ncbi:MAG: hypothetical protein JXR07_03965 [Reichenbachiella sp.]
MRQKKVLIGLILLGLFFFINIGNCQKRDVNDSLLIIYKSETITNTTKFKVLSELAQNEPNPNISLKYAQELIELGLSQSNNRWAYTGYLQKGHSLRLQGNLDDAISAYFLSVKAAKSINFSSGVGGALLSIGEVYANNNDHEKGIKYRRDAILVLRQTSDSLTLAGALMNTGYGYYLIQEYDSALIYYEESGRIYQNIEFLLGKAYNLGNAGLVYAKIGHFSRAEAQLIEAIAILNDMEDSYAITEFEIEIADILIQKKQYNQAEKHLLEALAYAQKDGLQERIRDASLKLSELYEIKEDFKRAFEYQDQYLSYRDSINNEDVIRKMADLRTEFEVGQKQIEVDLLSQEAKTQRVILWGVIVVLVLVFILAYVLYKLYRLRVRAIKIAKRRRQIITAQRNELEALNTTKDKFFSIISHDIRAPVNNFQGVSQLINMYIESGETHELARVTKMMDKSSAELSTLLDNLLDWAMSQQGNFPYKPESFNLTEVCVSNVGMMENLATAKEIKLIQELDDVSITADRNSVSTIVRNLVSNAIKFTNKGGEVKISLIKIDSQVEIEITDSGIGIPQDKISSLFGFKGERSRWGTAGEKGVGLGLNLVHEFVVFNNGEIEVESEEGKGTTFTVTLPLTLH